MLRQTIGIVTIVSTLMLGLLLTQTTPSTAGPLGILGFFVFMYGATLGALTFLFYGLGNVASKVPLLKQRKLEGGRASFKNAYYFASVAAVAPVMLIAMLSVGQIGPYQVLLVGIFVTVAWIYVKNRVI